MDRLPNPERAWPILKESLLIKLPSIKQEFEKTIYPNSPFGGTVETDFENAYQDIITILNESYDLDDFISKLEKKSYKNWLHDFHSRLLEEVKQYAKILKKCKI